LNKLILPSQSKYQLNQLYLLLRQSEFLMDFLIVLSNPGFTYTLFVNIDWMNTLSFNILLNTIIINV